MWAHRVDADVRVCSLLIDGILISSALAVAGKELVKQHLERLVLGHDVVLAQVVTAGGAGVHLGSKRPLETSLWREDGKSSFTNARRETSGNGCFKYSHSNVHCKPCKHCVSREW